MTQGTQTPPPPAGFWKIRHLAIGLGVLLLLVVLMLRACGSDEDGQASKSEDDMPRQAIIVQIPESQWQQQAPTQPPAPAQPGYGYMPQQPPPVADTGNPWAVQQPRPYDYGQTGNGGGGGSQWGQPQQQRATPQYYSAPPAASRYRPLEDENDTREAPRRSAPPPVPQQGYRPAAPYDRPAGSSFGDGGASGYAYPYGGYPGYYSPGAYGGLPGNPYMPGYPGAW